jgi:carbonic anhydrase
MATGGLTRQSSVYTHGIRTAVDGSVPAENALEKLREGNGRFVKGTSTSRKFDDAHRQALADHGQNPFATIIGCADSRCSLEIMFDVNPGDLFVLRNAGNTLTHAEGALIGSAEYSVAALGVNLVVVVGHTKCGAIKGATQFMLNAKGTKRKEPETILEGFLTALEPVAAQAELELQKGATLDEIAAHAVKVNVFNTIENLLIYSKPIREKVRAGEVEVQGAIYDIVTGEVEFLGISPRQPLVLSSQTTLILAD